MFNALNGFGGAGQLDGTYASDASNCALYATFAVVGFFAGTIVNALGIKKALSFGGLGYCVYVSSYLCFNHTKNIGYVVFAGCLLGCCAGVLWSAQGAIMMSYPPERLKGRFISWFWIIFNMGAVIGSLVSRSHPACILLTELILWPGSTESAYAYLGPGRFDRQYLHRLYGSHLPRSLPSLDFGRCKAYHTS